MYRLLRQALLALLVLPMLAGWMAWAQAAPTPAGTIISNTATASYIDAASGNAVRLTSNTVNTTVTALEALSLTANQNLIFSPGSSFTSTHVLTNTGNVATTYVIGSNVPGGGGFVPGNVQVVQDVNGNGVADPGEPVIAQGGGITLAAGQSVNLLLTGVVPATALPGQSAQVTLTATSPLQGATASNTDTLNVVNSAVLQVNLAASVATSTPGSSLGLTASASNTGNAAAGPVAVSVDGAAVNRFVLSLPVPANTAFASVPASGTPGAQTLYHLVGAAASSYVSVLPPGATVDAVAWALPSLAQGATLNGQLTVTINANASGAITDTATSHWSMSSQSGALSTASNPVSVALPQLPPSIAFYPNASYAAPSSVNLPGQPLFVQVNAAVCNVDPSQALSVAVTLTSKLTGDVETFTAVETGPNTGLFRIQPNVPTANAATHTVASGDGILEVLQNDVVTAGITSCGGARVSASTTLLIDPTGVVYDSKTNQPVAGASVQLIDVSGAGNGGNAGGPARVFQADGVTPAPSSVTTGPDGSYSFLLVPPSTYRLVVTAPAGYTFPSKLPAALQPAGRLIDTPGSYGGSFTVAGTQGPVHFDLPLDAGATGGLLIQKTANKATAEVGDFVDYSIQLNNGTGISLPATVVNDSLPAGFAYVRGTARLNGAPLPDPAGDTGPGLQFALGSIAAASQPTLTYRVRVGVGAQGGSGINTAQAQSGSVLSNRASARVQVVGGVFSNKAYIIGKVYADCGRDGVQRPGDPGIPGVRIYLEDGTYAVTDEEGKYSFYGLTPRTHIVKVDNTTLPAGASLEVLSNRNALDAGSLFADLTNGELFKANFAIAQCTPSIREQIAARRKALTNPSEILQAAGTLLSPNTSTGVVDARTLPAAGAMGLPGAAQAGSGMGVGGVNGPVESPQVAMAPMAAGIAPFAASAAPLGAVGDTGGPYAPTPQGLPRPLHTPTGALLQQQALPAPAASAPLATPASPEMAEPLETLIPGLDPKVGFVGLKDGEVLPSDQTRVRVKGPLGASFALMVDGRPVPGSQVGKKSSLDRNGVVAWEYIGVNLKPGRNVLALKALDGFGNVRGTAQITVLAPGPLARILIEAPPQAVADAATAVPVTILLRDANGLPVAARTPVMLRSSLGQWQFPGEPKNALNQQPGHQGFITGGEGRLLLLPPAQPGKDELSVSSGTVKTTATLEFTPHLRPLIAAGIVSGTLNLRNLNPADLQPAQSGDVFEREIQSTATSFDNGKADAAARTAFFLKGKVLGSSLLTLAYDSDKPADTTLFRDIQPNQFYPVYGDSSARGFEAQSTGKLYVLLQHGTSYALIGDYSTQTDNPARQLTQYARALNGFKGRWQKGALTVDGFASRTSSSLTVQQFRANGTSGPFQLGLNGVINSQQVDIITLDRNQPSVVLNDTPLANFTDYAIEPYTGLLLLKSPVPSVDANLNPIFIRVSYSVDNGGPKHGVEGVDAKLQLTPSLTLGATAIHDADPANVQTLQGVNLTARLGADTVATAEVAHSSTDLQGQGNGQRVDLKHASDKFQAHVWGVHTDADFYNPSSIQSAGSSEYGAKAGYTLDAKNRVVAEALKTASSTTGAEQTGVELKLEHSLPGNIKLELGVRHSSANAQSVLSAPPLPGTSAPVVPVMPLPAASSAQVGYTAARAKLTVPVPGVQGADVYGLAEYAVDGSGGKEIGLGGNYAVNATTRLYVRHDFINSLNGPYTLNPAVSQYTTVAGISTALSDSTQLFNEYRVGDSIDGRSAEDAVGLRRLWKLDNGVGLSASVQRIKPIRGVVTDQSNAVALGASYTGSPDWKGSTQAQWQTSSTSRSWLFTAGLANKLDADWTLLNRALYSLQTNLAPGSGARKLVTLQSGAAYRPVQTDVWNALGRIEYKRDADTTLGPGLNLDQAAWIAATNVNVQPGRSWVMSGRYAARWATDRSSGITSRSFTQLIGGRSTWDLSERWDAGLQGYRMWGDGATENAVGAEVGYLVWKNLWLSVGYNVKGFDAPDLSGNAYTQRGIYMRLRFKFDENLFSGSDSGHAARQCCASDLQPVSAARSVAQ